MSKAIPLGRITAVDTLKIELVEADETPAVVIIRWPAKPSILNPRRFTSLLITLPPFGHGCLEIMRREEADSLRED